MVTGYTNEMAAYDLLVIDDFGLMDLDIDKCLALFEIIETRDCRKSTVIVSQLPVIKWWDLFGDNTYADACLSRMTHRHIALNVTVATCVNHRNSSTIRLHAV